MADHHEEKQEGEANGHRPRAESISIKKKTMAPMNNMVYDFLLWAFTIVVDLFFREIHPRSSWKIPRKGPVIFVAAPHANQFVDPLILMRVIRNEAHRRLVFLIAEKSMHRPFVGTIARAIGAVPVGRALDKVMPADGKIYMPDPDNDPLLIKGNGTNFKSKHFQVGGLLVLPKVKGEAANAEILEIVSEDEIKLKRPFKSSTATFLLTGKGKLVVPDGQTEEEVKRRMRDEEFQGTPFKVAPKIDQHGVYDAVFETLSADGCIGIFPEGGSHDRTELLPIKPGVAIMALGALAKDPDCGLKIIPCGMNYFHAHKFRSRAVVEFGSPVEIDPKLVELYKKGERREAVGPLVDTVYQALMSVTVSTPDYDSLMLIQAVRRLYNPKGKKLPLPLVVELNRRLSKGYSKYKDDPRIVSLRKSVMEYNKQLLQLQIRDHQVEYATLPTMKVIGLILYRTSKLIILNIGTLPGLILFAPIFILGKAISNKKAKEALAASTVKVQARDVMATWKLLVAMALTPALLLFYSSVLTAWCSYNRVQGLVPEWFPTKLMFPLGMVIFCSTTYAALRIGEVGMDIAKSLKPLIIALSPSHGNLLVKLRERRHRLSAEVTELINTLGPEMFPDFDHTRIIADPLVQERANEQPRTPSAYQSKHQRFDSSGGIMGHGDDEEPRTPMSPTFERVHFTEGGNGQLPRNESFRNLGNIHIFASHPGTPHHERSRSHSGVGLHKLGGSAFAMSSLDSKEGFDEVSKRIRGAMKERGQRRRSESEKGFESGTSTPRSDDGAMLADGLTMTSGKSKKEQ